MFDDRFLLNNNFLQNSPLTSKPVLHLQGFHPEEWITGSGSEED
jgi:hypothetical protein